MQFSPILIYGPPGTGKTRFVRRLGEILKLHVNEISLSGSSDFLKITGSSKSWKAACVGDVVRGMAESKVANPLFVFDEIDKIFVSNQGSPIDRILLLTEPESASKFSDDFAEVPVDISMASIIAMANEIENLSGPLISRFQIVPILPLDETGRRTMIANVFKELCKSEQLETLIEPELDRGFVDALLESHLNGRELKNTIRYALERACLSLPLQTGGSKTTPISLEVKHLQIQQARVTRSIGFIR